MNRLLLLLGSASGLTAVAMGAFGAHGLKDTLTPNLMSAYETGVLYQFVHTLMIFVAVILSHLSARGEWFQYAATSFVFGILLFSGSLYGLALTNLTWLGPITPIGGVCFLLGWTLLIVAGIKFRNQTP